MTVMLKPGTRIYSSVCAAEFIAVRAPKLAISLTLGGEPPLLTPASQSAGTEPHEGHVGIAQVGKRYVDSADKVELLCTKTGHGLPALDGALLALKEAKQLPASD